MQLPFTVDQFLEVFHRYNLAVWPVHWILGVFRDHQPSGHRTIRTSAAITLGMIEDLGLLAAAIATVVAAIVRRADGGTPRGRLYPTGA